MFGRLHRPRTKRRLGTGAVWDAADDALDLAHEAGIRQAERHITGTPDRVGGEFGTVEANEGERALLGRAAPD